MDTQGKKLLLNTSKYQLKKCFSLSPVYFIATVIFATEFLIAPGAFAQGYGGGYGMGGMGGASGSMRGGMGRGSGGGGGFTLGYPGTNQAQIDQSLFNNNKEMLRNDVDYEDYLLRKRTAFAQQMQQNSQMEDKLRAYAERRLKSLTATKAPLNANQQAEAHDLMNWLKKDAEQRANNLAWLKRQDQAIASVEQDQQLSLANQRNALHNIYEDNLAVQSQYKWNQQMQLAALHQYQEINGVMYNSHQPYANYGYGGYGTGGFGYGFGGRWRY